MLHARPTLRGIVDSHSVRDQAPDAEERLIAADEERLRQRRFDQAMANLSARERQIIEALHLSPEPADLEALARATGVSPSRLRGLEASALQKLFSLGPKADLRRDILVGGRRLRLQARRSDHEEDPDGIRRRGRLCDHPAAGERPLRDPRRSGGAGVPRPRAARGG